MVNRAPPDQSGSRERATRLLAHDRIRAVRRNWRLAGLVVVAAGVVCLALVCLTPSREPRYRSLSFAVAVEVQPELAEQRAQAIALPVDDDGNRGWRGSFDVPSEGALNVQFRAGEPLESNTTVLRLRRSESGAMECTGFALEFAGAKPPFDGSLYDPSTRLRLSSDAWTSGSSIVVAIDVDVGSEQRAGKRAALLRVDIP